MFVFLHEQLVALSKSNRGFVDTDKLYFLPHLHEFPTRPLPLYESSDQPAILFLARVAHFSCSHNILSSCLFFSLLTTLVEYSILANSKCRYDLNTMTWDFSSLVPLKLSYWCQSCWRQSSTTFLAGASKVKSAGASDDKTLSKSMSELLVLPGQQARLERGEESGDRSILQTIRVKSWVGKPGKRKNS